MHLIKNDHLAGQTKGPHKSMFDVHRRHQRLVNSAYGKGGQQATLGLVEPGATRSAFFAHVGDLPGIGMQQQRAMSTIISQNLL